MTPVPSSENAQKVLELGWSCNELVSLVGLCAPHTQMARLEDPKMTVAI
jgi:hypothetical protein